MSNLTRQTDTEFQDVKLKAVSGSRDTGWSITREDGWSFWVDKHSPVEPRAGMLARFYGKGIGSTVRGLDLGGESVFWRTPEEQADKDDPIPKTVGEALAKWDAGESLFSISMGGFGPGYEMAIQGLAFELMRKLDGFTQWENETAWKAMSESLDPVVEACNQKPWGGFSGAQVGAARSLAACVCRRGYRIALRDKSVENRLIQVSKRDLRS